MVSKNKTSRCSFRIDATEKRKIAKAAAILGVSLNEFATTALIEQAQKILKPFPSTVLSNRDRDILLSLLDADTPPSAAMMRNAQRYKNMRNSRFPPPPSTSTR